MGPAAEQLIRDYLYRLSVAARGQLGPDDQRALVARAREFIERTTALAGPPKALEVGRLLYELGDPSALVQQERQRLVALRGELPEPPAIRNTITKLLRRTSGRPRASWHWPAVAGSPTDLQLTLLDSGDASTVSSNGTAADRGSRDDRLAARDKSAPYVPAQSGDPDWFFQALGGRSEQADPEATADGNEHGPESALSVQPGPPWPLAGAATPDPTKLDDDTTEPDIPAATTGSLAWQLTMPRDHLLPWQVRRALTATAAWCRRNPLEASAVALLGVGGAVYPPVWLVGAAVALPSRVWDGRDKWLGLALPVLLTIVAAALGITAAGHVSVGHSVHEGWVFGVAGSRVCAVLSAGYLCWRSVLGRRDPAVPPWNRPHRVS